MLGLYKTFDSTINEKINFSQWLPFLNSNATSQQDNNPAPQSQSLASQVTKIESANTETTLAVQTEQDPIDTKSVVATRVNSPQPPQPERPQPDPTPAAGSVLPEIPTAQAQGPGKTTVLVLSPQGKGPTKVSKVTKETDKKTGNADETTSLVTESANPASADTLHLLNDSDSSAESTQAVRIQAPIQPAGDVETEPAKARVSIHEVQSGENLTSIAAKLGTSVERLKQINRLSGDRILAGQNLIYEN